MRRPQNLKKSPTFFDKTAVFTQQCQNKWEIFSNFCCLFRKAGLYLSSCVSFHQKCLSAPLKKMTYFMEGPPKLHIEMDSCRSQQCVGSSRSVQRQQCFKAVIVVGSDNRIKISFSGVEPFSDLALLCLLRFLPEKMWSRCYADANLISVVITSSSFVSSLSHLQCTVGNFDLIFN